MLREKLNIWHESADNSKPSTHQGFVALNSSTLNRSEIKDTQTSKYFSRNPIQDYAADFLALEIDLNNKLNEFKFPHPIKYMYNPVEYAYDPHYQFVEKYCKNEKKILFLGMNPGPYGMCQTGIPFGEVNVVKEWFNIQCEINQPFNQCPSRPILGFNSTKSEASGKRFWNLFKHICNIPDNFFRFAFVHNYCPLAFMKEDGQNVTPVEIKGAEKKELERICNETLFKVIQLLRVEIIVGIGNYAEDKATRVLKNNNPLDTKVVLLPHPSRRAKKNENWPEKAEKLLEDIGVMQYFKTQNWLVN